MQSTNAGLRQPPAPPPVFPLLLITLGGFGLRLWQLDQTGLGYDEAATALMARATPAAIIAFHWTAAYEHPPVWQLLMHGWSQMVGQSEFALRLFPALAGVLAIPLSWLVAGSLRTLSRWLPLATAGLVAVAPTLIYYSQEARMYTLVVALSLLVWWFTLCNLTRPGWHQGLALALAGAAMTLTHYYSLLATLVCGLGVAVIWWTAPSGRRAAGQTLAWLALSLAPVALWLAGSPGFHATMAEILGGVGGSGGKSLTTFAGELGRELLFGSVRFVPAQAAWAFLWLAPAVAGSVYVMRLSERPKLFPLLLSWLPVLFSVLLFRTLAARYLLFVLPPFYLLAAAGLLRWGRWQPLAGAAGFAGVLTLSALALIHYFGPYLKADYREMMAELRQRRSADEVVMLYAPRQHLLTRYYAPESQPWATAPAITLPDYWPVNAPPVIPEAMDGEIRRLLAAHGGLWLVQSAENEVDPGEFIPKYLTAVSYRDECWTFLDGRLCHFLSPAAHDPVMSAVNAPFDGALTLVQAGVAVEQTPGDQAERRLVARLDWLAPRQPAADYRVTLRLVNTAGEVVAQRDEFPIGTLLPPTTWQAGDAKPGYMVLPLPAGLPGGDYRVTVGLYDAATGAPTGEAITLSELSL